MIDKSNGLPSIQHENQTGETYSCCASTRNVRQPKFEKSVTIPNILIELQSYNIYIFLKKLFNHCLFSKTEGQINQIRFILCRC